MAYNQQLSVLGQVAPATTGTAGQVLVSAGSSASSYWAATIPVSAYSGQFNGSSQYFSVGTTSDFKYLHDATSDWTVECWVYPTTLNAATGQYIVTTDGESAFVGTFINLSNYTNGDITVGTFRGASGSSTGYTTSTNTVVVNTWQHIAVTFTASTKTYAIYVNGVSKSLSLSTGATAPSSFAYSTANHTYPLNVGRYVTGSTSGGYFPGYISNLRIVKSVVYTGAFTPPTSPLGTAQGSGTNIAAISASQTSLLTCNGPGFTDSSPNAFTLTNTGSTTTSQFAPFSSFSAIARSATQTQTVLTSGSGTYYPPSGVAWLRIRMVGGGGGGAVGGGGAGGGSNGTNTTFGTSLLTAAAGGGASGAASYTAGIGGTASIGSGASGIALSGAAGFAAPNTIYPAGGNGGSTAFGGGGAGAGASGSAGPGSAASTNSGAGGGGGNYGSASSSWPGAGGGGGGYVEAYISSPAASYAYTVGAGGAGAAASGAGGAGGGGGSGIIIVEENYPVNSSLNIATASTIGFSDGTSFGTAQSLGTRNRVINGAMVIDQRNAGASVSVSTTYPFTVDRWQATNSQNSKFTVQQNAGSVTPPTGFTNYAGLTSSSAYSLLSTDLFGYQQGIEGYNVADLGWGATGASTVTLSFWARSSLTGTFGGNLSNAAGNRCYVFSYTINTANTWEYKTITVPGDTTGTWLKTNGCGMYLIFSIGAGSGKLTTAGSWGGTYYESVTGQTNVVGTNGATWYITGIQLESGLVATPFERRQYQQELALCQRYCCVYAPSSISGQNSIFGAGVASTTTLSFIHLPFSVPLRAVPTFSYTGAVGNLYVMFVNGTTYNALSTIALNGFTNLQSAYLSINYAAGGSAGQGVNLISDTTKTVSLIFAAEF